jgi:competence protein ComEC
MVGPIAPPLAHVLGDVCNWNLHFLEWCVTKAQEIPGGHFWAPGPADWWLCGFYGALGLLAAFPRLRPARRRCVALLALWIAIGFGASLWPRGGDRLDCTFLSMGHGCAVLLELPSGQTMLYDAGQMGEPRAAARAIAEFLWHRGRTRIDAVVLSHPDIDHYNALPGLLEKFRIGAVYVSPMMFEKANRAVAALRDAIDRSRVPLREVRAGDRLRVGGDCDVEVLHPSRVGVLGSDNANSVVLAVRHSGGEILLPGDLESPGLEDLLAEEPRRVAVLLAPHHGSRKSNSPELARWCRPRWVVFSDDGRLNTPEIDRTYQALGGQTLHTWNSGAVHVAIGAAGIRVSPLLKPQP